MHHRAWPLTCALLIAASVALWLAGISGHVVPQHWLWHAEFWPRQPWTLWTGPLLHFLGAHLAGNALALAALAVLGAALHAPRADALALLLAWPLGTLALTLWPAVGGFYGLSGLVHAAAAIVALRALADPQLRWLGLLVGGGLMIKLALERGWAVPVAFDSAWGFNVVFAAHLAGASVGAGMLLLLEPLAQRRVARHRELLS